MTVFNCSSSLPRCSLLYLIVSTSPWKTPHNLSCKLYYLLYDKSQIPDPLYVPLSDSDCPDGSHWLFSVPPNPQWKLFCLSSTILYLLIHVYSIVAMVVVVEEKRPPLERKEALIKCRLLSLLRALSSDQPMGFPHSISPSFPSGN